MSRNSDLGLSLTGSYVGPAKKSPSTGERPLSSGGSRPNSTGSPKLNRSGGWNSQAPLSARSVTFGSSKGTPRTPNSAHGKTGSRNASPRSILSCSKQKNSEKMFGPYGDKTNYMTNGHMDSSSGKQWNTTKHKRASSLNTNISTQQRLKEKTGSEKGKKTESTDDFLALFNSSHQPVIKNRTPGGKNKKNSTKQSKEPISSRAFTIPISARSNSTIDSYEPNSVRPDSRYSLEDDRLNSSRDVTPRTTHRESLPIDTKNLVQNSLANAMKTVQSSNYYDQIVTGDDEDDFVPNEEIVYHVNNRTSAKSSLGISVTFEEDEDKEIKNSGLRSSGDKRNKSPEHRTAEEYIKNVNEAATKIQRWYREQTEKKQGENEIKQLLRSKRQEREELMNAELTNQVKEEQRTKERKRIREEKQRMARQAAIEELQRKREAKQKEIKEKAEEELRFLQASGKVSKKPTTKTSRKKSSNVNSKPKEGGNSVPEPNHGTEGRDRPGIAGSMGQKVENIFEASSPKSHDGAADTLNNGDLPVAETTSVTANTKTTLDDLLDTLKLLEEPVSVPTPEAKKQKGPAWLDIFDEKEDNEPEEKEPVSSRLQPAKDNQLYLSAENLQELANNAKVKPKPKPKSTPHALLTEEKIKNIMSFLDEVEKADPEEGSIVNTQRDPPSELNPPTLVPSAEEIIKLENATAAASEVTNTILSQRLQLEEKERTVKMLQTSLNQQRELTVRHAKEQDKEMKTRLNVQKEEYEATIKRHLSFIDQLIDDKKALSEKYDAVVTELKQMDRKYTTRIKAMEENHNLELQKVKDVQAAAEKIRREKWMDEKTKKIKEITVKGLEPEIQKLIANHKAEVKKLKTIHEAEMLQAEERAGQKYIKHTEDLREQLALEKEQACMRERELCKQRYEKQLEQEESNYQQQRRRLYSDIQEEKERLAEQAKKQRQEIDRMQTQMEENNRKALATMREEYEKARDEQERRHKSEVKDLEERLRIEKESWEENYMKKQETWLLSKERELREHVRAERDREIELVITRLEEDAASAREETERAAENRVKRIRDKYEAELREIELSERNTQERYNELKAKLSEVEAENYRFEGIIKQKGQEVFDVKKVCDRLTTERNNVQDVIRQEFADRLVATEEENKRLKNEMSEMRARHKLEISRIETSKDEEMEEVHKRVKQAIAKKEEVVSQLKEQHAAAVKRADHLESLLEQQRKQLVKKK